MPFFENCTLAFESLAVRPFDNSRIGDLSAIHQPGINLVLGTRTFSPEAQARLQELDVIKLATTHGKNPYAGEGSHKWTGMGGGNNISRALLLQSVGPVLERILPSHPANHAVARDLALMLGDVSAAYNNAPLTYYLIANLPGSQGVFHHDNHTEHRWLVTLPTRPEVRGTWLADDFFRKYPVLPGSVPTAGTGKGWEHNNYGRPSALWNHLIREAPTGRLLGWHGEETGTPRIHSEPDVISPEAARLTVIATPTAMHDRATARGMAARKAFD